MMEKYRHTVQKDLSEHPDAIDCKDRELTADHADQMSMKQNVMVHQDASPYVC